MNAEKHAPLEGLDVLDLTHRLSGPFGTMLLTDLGARTIEPPGEGEGPRQLLAGSAEWARDGMGAYFLTLNRGNESVAIDLKSATGLGLQMARPGYPEQRIDDLCVGGGVGVG